MPALPAAQSVTREGIVVCPCGHQALFHAQIGCMFCDCRREGTSFDYEERFVESPDPMLQFFEYAHLPPALQETSKPYCALAHHAVATQPRNPERTAGLRKILEAKDCAVRAVLYKP